MALVMALGTVEVLEMVLVMALDMVLEKQMIMDE
jgi:hypothetical protein